MKNKPALPDSEFVAAVRRILTPEEFKKAYDNILRIATGTKDDPKSMMSAVKAFEALRECATRKHLPIYKRNIK